MRAAGASLRFIRNVHCLLVNIVKVWREENFFSTHPVFKSLIVNWVIEAHGLKKMNFRISPSV